MQNSWLLTDTRPYAFFTKRIKLIISYQNKRVIIITFEPRSPFDLIKIMASI